MKKTLILLIGFLLISCGNTEEQGVVEETGKILNDYVDTLEGTISDAKEVKELINQNQDKLKDNLNNIY